MPADPGDTTTIRKPRLEKPEYDLVARVRRLDGRLAVGLLLVVCAIVFGLVLL